MLRLGFNYEEPQVPSKGLRMMSILVNVKCRPKHKKKYERSQYTLGYAGLYIECTYIHTILMPKYFFVYLYATYFGGAAHLEAIHVRLCMYVCMLHM